MWWILLVCFLIVVLVVGLFVGRPRTPFSEGDDDFDHGSSAGLNE